LNLTIAIATDTFDMVTTAFTGTATSFAITNIERRFTAIDPL
jgi:hypothetical protein